MESRSRLAGAAGLLAVTGLVAAATVAGTWLAGDARRLLHAPEPATLLLAVVEACAAALLARCAVSGGLTLVALVLRRRHSGCGGGTARAAVRVSPRLLRPAISGLLAAGIATAVVVPASAATRSPDLPAAVWSAPTAPSSAAVGGAADQSTPKPPADALPPAGWTPAAHIPAPPPVRLVASTAQRETAARDVVVRRGDCLWAIVARALGPHATTARVAAEWPRWYAANRRAIGSDPDLLRPGTTLHAPAPAVAR